MPWILDTRSHAIEIKHLVGQTPGGKIRVVANVSTAKANLTSFFGQKYLYAGGYLSAIITTNDSASSSGRTRTITTQAPAESVVPGQIGGLIQAEAVEETYVYLGVASSGCIGPITGGLLQSVTRFVRRPLGTFADWAEYMKKKGQAPPLYQQVVVEIVKKTYQHDNNGLCVSIVEEKSEDPRVYAGRTVGIKWEDQIITGPVPTHRTIQSWDKIREGDFQYSFQRYEPRCVNSTKIPSGTPLIDQVSPVLVESEPSASTSQNQPPTERAPAQWAETSYLVKEELDFTDAASPFSPKLRVYSLDSWQGSRVINAAPTLWELGVIFGQHEFGQANQIRVLGDLQDEWFDWTPYRSVRIDEPRESGIYAIANLVVVLDQDSLTVGFRGLLVAVLVAEQPVLPYVKPIQALRCAAQLGPVTCVANLRIPRLFRISANAQVPKISASGVLRRLKVLSCNKNVGGITCVAIARALQPHSISGPSLIVGGITCVATARIVQPVQVAWLYSESGITASSGLVDSWQTSTGEIVTATGSGRPGLTSFALNGFSVVAFDGNDDFMTWSRVSPNKFPGACTIFAVLANTRTSGGDSVDVLVGADPSLADNNGLWTIWSNNRFLQPTPNQLLVEQRSNLSLAIRINGVPIVFGTGQPFGIFYIAAITISGGAITQQLDFGRYRNGLNSYRAKQSIAAFGFVDEVLSLSQIQQIESSLSSKYGIPI